MNLREAVLEHRVRYATSALLDEEAARDHRAKALAALERCVLSMAAEEVGADVHPGTTDTSSWSPLLLIRKKLPPTSLKSSRRG